LKVRFLMLAEIQLNDDGHKTESGERDAEKMLDLYREAAANALGAGFGVCLHRSSDDDLLEFPIWEIPDDEGWRSLVPPVISPVVSEGGDQSPA
jgi:hypothetical protein